MGRPNFGVGWVTSIYNHELFWPTCNSNLSGVGVDKVGKKMCFPKMRTKAGWRKNAHLRGLNLGPLTCKARVGS